MAEPGDLDAGLVSTVIPVRNRPRMLEEAVASVFAQSHRPIEVVVVDDASDDATPEVLRRLEDRSGGLVRGVRHDSCRGPGASRETGRLACRGEFLQYLDSDDLLAPRKFEQQISALHEHPECGLAYGDVEEEWGVDPPARKVLPRMERALPRMLVDHVWHSFVPLYRRSLSDAAGPWLPLFHEEDWEYDLRVAATGVSLCKVDGVVGRMRRHGEGHLSGGASTWSLANRATARRHMLAHAQRAGVPREAPEMQRFVRALFLLSRQCGAAGLVAESRELFTLARAQAPEPDALDYRGYAAVVRVVGWRSAGLLAQRFDRLRTRRLP